jgi:hypothetical protein
MFLDIIAAVEKFRETLLKDSARSAQSISKLAKSDGFNSTILEIVEKHMKLTLSRVSVYPTLSVNASAGWEIPDQTVGAVSRGKFSPPEFMAVVAKQYNHRTGAYASLRDVSKYMKFSLMVTSGLLGLTNAEDVPFLTAEEVAAVILHEIGHFDHFIRTLFRTTTIVLDACDVLNRTAANHDLASARTLLHEIDRGRLPGDWRKIYDKVEAYFAGPSADPNDSQFVEALDVLILIYRKSNGLLIKSLWAPWILSHGDRFSTNNEAVDAERSADEFSARNGAYSALIGALAKMRDDTDLRRRSVHMTFVPLAVWSILDRIGKSMAVFTNDSDGVYDGFIPRLRMIADTAKHAMHDPDLPKDVKSDIAAQVEEAELRLKELTSAPYRRTQEALRKLIGTLGAGASALLLPFEYRVVKDTERLQTATRDISRNSLYYLADKHNG